MTTTRRRVFLTDLAAYNEGILIGKWLELPMDEEELKAEINQVLKDGFEAAQKEDLCCDSRHEEYFITDWEGLGFMDLDIYSNIFRINEDLQDLEDFSEDEEILEALIDEYGLEEALDIIYEGNYVVYWESKYLNFDRDGDLALAMYEEETLGLEIPEELESYFDWVKYERDLLIDIHIIYGEGFAIQVY